MKKLLMYTGKWILSGSLFGVGLAVIVNALIFSQECFQPFEGNERVFSPNGITLTNTYIKPWGNSISHSSALGTVVNTGGNAWDDIQIRVEVFDKGGVILDQQDILLDKEGTINPEEVQHFKVHPLDVGFSNIVTHSIRIISAELAQ